MEVGDTVWSVAWGDGRIHVREHVIEKISSWGMWGKSGESLNPRDDSRIGGCFVGIRPTREEAIACAQNYMERQRAVYAAEIATVDGLIAKLNAEATR